jgi:glycosyltransferase involved in cell wall biosynthesis
MNILYVIGSQINGFPPARNAIELLLENGHSVTVLARDSTGLQIVHSDNLKIVRIPEAKIGIPEAINYCHKTSFMRKNVMELMKENDVIWTATDATVRDLGRLLFDYKHVMQLMELIYDIPKYPGQKFIKLNIKQYAQRAHKVVVPEYNRAHIQKTWWDLEELPAILPNKMKQPKITEIPQEVVNILNSVREEKRKIVLYQGVFNSDRNLEPFIEATLRNSEKYCFCMMGTDSEYRRELSRKYPNVRYIPFIKPPYHLLITQQAYIGVMPYRAVAYLHYDKLNALYCAPNKIFEYSCYGIPMIGTDVPGLSLPFNNKIGITCGDNVDEIAKSMQMISENYNEYSNNCRLYYQSFDMNSIIKQIID